MTEPKYQPTDDEPRIAAWSATYDHHPEHGVRIEGDADCETREEAEDEVQCIALAIADRVHGAELAALRAEVAELRDREGAHDDE